MGVYAVTKGKEIRLKAATVDEVVEVATENALTGSAVPLTELLVETADGDHLAYAEIDTLIEHVDREEP